MFFLHCMLYIWRYKKLLVKLVNQFFHNKIQHLIRCFWVFLNSEFIFYLIESFLLKKIEFPLFSLSPAYHWVNQLRYFWKTTSGITLICSTISEEIDDTSSFIVLTTTPGCIISDEMFYNNSISITFKCCINNFFLETSFLLFFHTLFFLGNLISLSLSLSLGSWIFWQLSSCFRVSSRMLF